VIKNRFVPTDTIRPNLVCENVADAWLTTAFGFTEQFRYGQPDVPFQGVRMYLGDAGSRVSRFTVW
jgi:hypothetical protein